MTDIQKLDEAIEGLKILSDDVFPVGWIPTSIEARDDRQQELILVWLNKRRPVTSQLIGGGTYHGYASEMANGILSLLSSLREGLANHSGGKISDVLKQAIDLLKIETDANGSHYLQEFRRSVMNEVLALLATVQAEQVCPTCNGDKYVEGKYIHNPQPCPACTDGTLESNLRKQIKQLEILIDKDAGMDGLTDEQIKQELKDAGIDMTMPEKVLHYALELQEAKAQIEAGYDQKQIADLTTKQKNCEICLLHNCDREIIADLQTQLASLTEEVERLKKQTIESLNKHGEVFAQDNKIIADLTAEIERLNELVYAYDSVKAPKIPLAEKIDVDALQAQLVKAKGLIESLAGWTKSYRHYLDITLKEKMGMSEAESYLNVTRRIDETLAVAEKSIAAWRKKQNL